MNAHIYTRSLPVRYEVDVLVAGGGPSGVAAAVVAARNGARVFLVEAGTCLGGSGTAAGIAMFCSPTDGVHETSAGFGSELYDRLIDAGATAPGITRENKYTQLIVYKVEDAKRVYDAVLSEAGVPFLFTARLVDVVREGGRVTTAVCAAKSGLFAVRAKVFVDATGDGDLCAFAGAECEFGDPDGSIQASTLPSVWAGIDWERAKASGCGPWTHERRLREAYENGVFKVYDRHLPGLVPMSDHTAMGNVGHVFGVDGRSEESLTRGFVEGRRGLQEYVRYYREYMTGFEDVELVSTGSLFGIRESRRVMGDYMLSLADFERRAHFDDEIGCFSYPVDFHSPTADEEAARRMNELFRRLRYKSGENYGIPYRTLLPRGLDNVLVAGRCISCDRYIQASVRVMPGCFITGQAAGMAAALAVRDFGGTPRDLPATTLRDALRSRLGAYLP